MTLVYLSGPISGMPDGNRLAFARAAVMLNEAGFFVKNPHDLFNEPAPTEQGAMRAYWQRAMRADIRALVDCDRIAMLPGWEKSEGAVLEHMIAAKLGIGAIYMQWEAAVQPVEHHPV
jgi:hypothetical protein